MSNFYCPHCDHKSFRNETGLQWHMFHIHGSRESSSGISATMNSPQAAKFELKEFENSVTEKVNSRLDVFTKRDAWLSDRISALEEGGKCRIPLKAKCTLQKSSCAYHPKLNFESNRS